MLTGINKKIQIMIGILVTSSLLIMITYDFNRPLLLVYITMFTQWIFNQFFGYMLVIACYIMFRKYEHEFTIKDMGTLALVSCLLMVLCFAMSNTIIDTGKTQPYNYLLSWIYLIDIVFVCAFFACKKQQYQISLFPLFIGYSMITIGFSFLVKVTDNIMLIQFFNAWMQLSMLFWVESLMSQKTYQRYEWLGITGMIIVLGIICGVCGNMILIIPLIHLCLWLYMNLMKTFLPIKHAQIYAVIILLIILIGLQFINHDRWVTVDLVESHIWQIYLMIMSIIVLLISHQYSMKILTCCLLVMTVALPILYDQVYNLSILACTMQVISMGILMWMYKKKMKWISLLLACLVCLCIMMIVLISFRN